VARTYLVPLDRVGDLRVRPIANVASLSYVNGGFSQGLAWDGHYLYESANAIGSSEIRVLDVAAAIDRGDASAVREVGRLAAPAGAVEDLETDGDTLWTSDESSFRFYRLTGLPQIRARLEHAHGDA
jgi:hypothetical protein